MKVAGGVKWERLCIVSGIYNILLHLFPPDVRQQQQQSDKHFILSSSAHLYALPFVTHRLTTFILLSAIIIISIYKPQC